MIHRWFSLCLLLCAAVLPEVTLAADGATVVVQTGFAPGAEGPDRWSLSPATQAPLGHRLAVSTRADQTAQIWDLDAATVVHRLAGHTEPIVDIAYGPEGRFVVTGSDDGTARLWSAETGQSLQVLRGHEGSVTAVAYSSMGGGRVVTGGYDGTVRLWRPGTDKPRSVWKTIGEAWQATVSPSGDLVAVVVSGRDSFETLVWDLRTRKRRHRFEGGRSVAFSPDGAFIAVGTNEAVHVVDAERGQPRHPALPVPGDSVGFSPDGTMLFTSARQGGWTLWHAADGARLHDSPAQSWVSGFAFQGSKLHVSTSEGWSTTRTTPDIAGEGQHPSDELIKTLFALEDGRVMAIGKTNTRQWAPAPGRDATTLFSYPRAPSTIQNISADGGMVVVVDWDPMRWQPIALAWNLSGPSPRGGILSEQADSVDIRLSDDGRRAAVSSTGRVEIKDAATGSLLRRFDVGGNTALSADGSRLATFSGGQADVWSVTSGEALGQLRIPGMAQDNDYALSMSFTPDGTALVMGRPDGRVARWTIGEASTSWKRLHRGKVFATESPDGSAVLSTCDDEPPALWNPTTDKVRRFDDIAGCGTARFSRDGTRFLCYGGVSAIVYRLDGTKQFALPHESYVDRGRFVGEKDERIVTAGADGTLHVWSGSDGAMIASLVRQSGEWAVVDAEGRFDASPSGRDSFAWVIDNEPYDLDQLRAQYFEPRLLAKALGFQDAPMRDVPSLTSIRPPPRLAVGTPDPSGRVSIEVASRGAGIGEVQAWLNDSDVSKQIAAQCPDLVASGRCDADLSALPTWRSGVQNALRVAASSARSSVQSRGLMAVVLADGPTDTRPPELWVLSVGTGDYSASGPGGITDLVFPPADAAAIAKALGLAGKAGFEQTHVKLLTTADRNGRPSKKNVQAALEWLRGSHDNDTVVLFFSGHGHTQTDPDTEQSDYYYLLPDAGSLADLKDAGLRDLRTLSASEIADALTKVSAGKRLVILDTCGAGGATAALTRQKSVLSEDAIRAHRRAQERTGAWFIGGSAADKLSYEDSVFGQGLLTYTLLEAMKGPALGDDRVLMVSRLANYAKQQVPTYAKLVQITQEPELGMGQSDFPLGRLTSAIAGQIPLPQARERMVPAKITRMVDGMPEDGRKMEEALNEALRAYADEPGRGRRVVWLDSKWFDGAWRVLGTYETTDSGISFKGRIQGQRLGRRGEPGETVNKPFTLKATDVNDAVAQIVQTVKEVL